eukprot:TRINITY_DN41983_c0_g2_i2.p1 TRINITY_DN41983_c0_g2~~TRINITY_DN41983_c0_g2_i2.p1  ORF type:complete len:379 (-),score=40.36 TRINITY_DN41983_c0_g2_i2:344-1480(-)
MAIDMIKKIGKSCDVLAVETNKFKGQTNDIYTDLYNLTTTIQSTRTELQLQYQQQLKKEAKANQTKNISKENFMQQIQGITERIKSADEQYNQIVHRQKQAEQKILQINESKKGLKEILDEQCNQVVHRQEEAEQKIFQSNVSKNVQSDEQQNTCFTGFIYNLIAGKQSQKTRKEKEKVDEGMKEIRDQISKLQNYNRRQKKEFKKELQKAQMDIEKVDELRKELRDVRSNLRQEREQELAVKLGPQFEEHINDPSLLMEVDPFFENAMKHSKEVENILKGLEQLWATIGQAYSEQLPESISTYAKKMNQEEKEQFWNTREVVSSFQNITQVWTLIKQKCNVMNEIRLTQQHVLSYYAKLPINVTEAREMIARERERD